MKAPAVLARLLVFAATASLLGSGCIAVTVGTPKTYEVPGDAVPQTKAENRLQTNATGIRTVSAEIVPEVSYDVKTYAHLAVGKRDGSTPAAFRDAKYDRDLKPGEVSIRLNSSLKGSLVTERELSPSWRVEVRHRISFGLFPAWAESMLKRDNSLSPYDMNHVPTSHLGNGRGGLRNLLYPIAVVASTAKALIVEPFDWSDRAFECHTHGFAGDPEPEREVAKYGYESEEDLPFRVALQVPELRLPRRADMSTRSVRWKDPWTGEYWNETVRTHSPQFDFTHQALLGMHKWREIVVERNESGQTVPGQDAPFSSAGSYVLPDGWMDLSIPSLQWSQRRRAEKGSPKVVFSLPPVAPGAERVSAILRFSASSADAGMLDRGGLVARIEYGVRQTYDCSEQDKLEISAAQFAALSALATRELPLALVLPVDPAIGTELPKEPPSVSVVEVHHHWYPREVETTGTRPYDVETAEPFADGHAAWTVTILDESKTADEVDAMVRPFIERNLREAFVAANAVSDESAIRAHVAWTVDGRALRYDGTVWLLAADVEAFAYDASSRRGTASLRIPPHADVREFKAFARRTIGEIVRDKNISLAVDSRPPEGARYEVVDENFHPDTRLLVVEFEAVE